MSSDIAIGVSNVSKHYQIYDKPLDRLKQSFFRGQRQYYKEFKALNNISFEVRKGETVGIIGRNGSGKSTLLQMICGTLMPTMGNITINGRVAALLELGAGFNPEFTGRENVYMNAAILGLSKDEIIERLPKILKFADIGDFIEQPVKTYSSGMYVRLAFSVAINVDPDILIIDEALAVGDELFQQKCYSKINSLRESGVTVLFVSHAASAIVELCGRAILLDRGECVFDGKPKTSIALYHKFINANDAAKEKIRNEILEYGEKSLLVNDVRHPDFESKGPDIKSFYDPEFVSRNGVKYEINSAEISHPIIQTLEKVQVNNLVHGEEYIYSYKVHFFDDIKRIQYGMLIKSVNGLEIGGAIYPANSSYVAEVSNGSDVIVSFHFTCLLNPGVYFMNAGVQGEKDEFSGYLHRLVDTLAFRVQPENETISTGIVNFYFKPDVSVGTG